MTVGNEIGIGTAKQGKSSSSAYLYLRVSSKQQEESGIGIDAQEAACRAHAERLGLRVVASRADRGISGGSPLADRPGLLELLKLVGPGDVVLVSKRDRIARGDPVLVYSIEGSFAAEGARFVSVAGEGTDGEVDDAGQILMRRVIDAIAENFRLVGKARTREALATLKRQGRRTGQLAYGLELTGDGPESKSGRPSSVTSSARDAEALGLIAELDATGWSHRAIARELDHRGFPTKNAGRLNSTGRRNPTGRWASSTVCNLAKRLRAAAPAPERS